jgi:hypothetical protein
MSTEAKTVGFGAGQDPAMLEANRVYQEALAKLTQSLDTRKNRFFDPVLLAAAQGFGAPTQTGSFGESLGIVAKNVGAAQEQETKLEQEIAQQRVAAAGKGVELQRMRARDADIAEHLAKDQPTSKPAPVAGPLSAPIAGPRAVPDAPTGPLPTTRISTVDEPLAPPVAASATPVRPPSVVSGGPLPAAAPPTVVAQAPQGALTAIESNKPPGYEGVEGIQVAPANRNFLTGREYIKLNRNDPSKSFAEVVREAQEIEQKRYRDKENGVLDLATGLYYQFPTGKTEEMEIYGYPGTYKVDARIAAKLNTLAANNDPAYYDLAKRVIEGPLKKGDATTNQDAPSGGRKSVQQLAVEQKEAESRATKLGEADAKKESSLSDTKATASRIYGSATRVLNSLKESANFFGIFERTGYGPAILGAVDAGIRTQNGSISFGDLQSAVTKVMPGVSQKDLDNVKKAASELAEIELQYTKLYVSGDGAITEGERKIVRAIPGTVSSSPEVLRTRMELLKSRSQFDLDVADAFEQWQDKNPGRPYREFERKSSLYKNIKKDFEEQTEKLFGGIKAVPTSQRKQEAAPAGTPSPGFIRDPVTGIIRKKKAGE